MRIKLDQHWTKRLLQLPESGMGYQRVDVRLADGRELRDVLVFNCEEMEVPREFAGAHGKFWEMHDEIFENQDRLGLPLLFALVGALGLSETDLRSALVNRDYEPKVRADFLGGVRSGVNGTPAFFINGVRHDGSYAFEDLTAAIEARLHAAESL